MYQKYYDDIIGKEYNGWTILKFNIDRTVVCQCKCGKIRNKAPKLIINGLVKKCSTCANHEDFKDLTDKKFNNWKVIRLDSKKIGKQYYWQCLCTLCNTIHIVNGHSLLSGITTKCKQCKNRKHKMHALWYQTKRNATVRKISFYLTYEDLEEVLIKQNYKCVLSGEPISVFKTRSNQNGKIYMTASIDRIDSNKGYTKDNIQFVHKDVNIMKWTLPQDLFISWCKKIAINN